MTTPTTLPSKSTKPSSTALSLITKKLNSDIQLNKPGPFNEKSPEHQESPSLSSSEEEHAEANQFEKQRSDNKEVSQKLRTEGEGDKEDADKGKTEWTNEGKAAKMDSTEEVAKQLTLSL